MWKTSKDVGLFKSPLKSTQASNGIANLLTDFIGVSKSRCLAQSLWFELQYSRTGTEQYGEIKLSEQFLVLLFFFLINFFILFYFSYSQSGSSKVCQDKFHSELIWLLSVAHEIYYRFGCCFDEAKDWLVESYNYFHLLITRIWPFPTTNRRLVRNCSELINVTLNNYSRDLDLQNKAHWRKSSATD